MINYNDPIEVTEIFRLPIAPPEPEDGEDYSPEIRDIILRKQKTQPEYEYEEYSLQRQICWEDIKTIRQYGYKDNWKNLKGEKFLIHLGFQQDEILVLGSYRNMCDHWRTFRNTYPIFVK